MAAGPSIHRLPYLKTDCTDSFEVANNSLARAVLRLEQRRPTARDIGDKRRSRARDGWLD